jgi:iron(III) transport system substrate-binding protein
MKKITTTAAILAALTLSAQAQTVPEGYPASYADVIAAAQKEGALSIYSTTDLGEMTAFLDTFKKKYPGIKVDYLDTSANQMYSRFIAENSSGSPSADFIWSTTMDYVLSLAKQGYAMQYESPEAKALPDFGAWNSAGSGTPEVYYTTFEPMVFVYNTRLVPKEDVPQTRADILKLLKDKKDKYGGKVTAQDVAAGGGYLLWAQESARDPEGAKELTTEIAKTGGNFELTSGVTIEKVVSGENLIATHVIGSYSLTRQAKDLTVGLVLPKDKTLVVSRLALISKKAPHPNAAKLFLDFMLSKEGQTLLCDRAMGVIRTDGTGSDACLLPGQKEMPKETFFPMDVKVLLDSLEPKTKLTLVRDWKGITGK